MMNTNTIHRTAIQSGKPLFRNNGCENVTDGRTLKMQLRTGRGLSSDAFLTKVLGILKDKKESLPNKTFAVQNLSRVKSAKAENSLLRIVTEKDTRLSYAALSTLSLTGTKKTYDSLAKIGSLPYKSLTRQKDFTLVMIGYRQQLPGAEKILARLIKSADTTGNVETFPLKFELMDKPAIAGVLKQSKQAEYGIVLSRKRALTVKAGGQTYYFCFTSRFDKPEDWSAALQTNQIVGQLLMQENHSTHINKQYIALATPMRGYTSLSIFRRNGELFMLARVIYDNEKKSFVVSNPDTEPVKTKSRATFSPDQKNFIILNLSYIRHHKKRNTETTGMPPTEEIAEKRSLTKNKL